MKNLLITLSMIALLMSGCNNDGSTTSEKKVERKDTMRTTLKDISTATDIKKLIGQQWENKEDAADAALSGDGEGLEMPYRGFAFFEDGSVVENPRDKMRFGIWSVNDADKLITIDYAKGGKSQLKIVAIGAKEMILMNMADKKQTTYQGDAKVHADVTEDPFHISNNEWRIKPVRAESDSAVKLRTAQCVLFYAKFLADNANRGGSTISFVGLPGCFKWYKGGVSITGFEKVDSKWINCFYNKAQAAQAHAMLEGIISKPYRWDKEELNWVKQSADVVRQMYDTLKVI